MSFLKYKFCEESKSDLLQFLKVAKEVQPENVLCDMKEYEKLRKLIPLDNKLKQELKAYTEQTHPVIDITKTDDEENKEEIVETKQLSENFAEDLSQILTQSSFNQPTFNTEDIVYAIKENLDTKKKLPPAVLEHLNKLTRKQLETVFKTLSQELSLDSVQNLWLSVQDVANINELVVICYVRLLFLKKIKTEYSDEVQQIFGNLSIKHPTLLKKELVKDILEDDGSVEGQRMLVQYISTLDNNFKSGLLRELLSNCSKLDNQQIPIIEAVLNSQTEYNLLSQLVELMSHSVTDFTTNKPYGKLLLKIVKLLGKKVTQLEQPLKHILGLHKSIWKKEVEKYVVSNFSEDTMTQF